MREYVKLRYIKWGFHCSSNDQTNTWQTTQKHLNRRNNINSHHICQYWGIWWLLRTLHINWISECLEEMMELCHYQNIFRDIVPLYLIKPVFTLLSKQHNHTDLVYWFLLNSSASFGYLFQQSSGKNAGSQKEEKMKGHLLSKSAYKITVNDCDYYSKNGIISDTFIDGVSCYTAQEYSSVLK